MSAFVQFMEKLQLFMRFKKRKKNIVIEKKFKECESPLLKTVLVLVGCVITCFALYSSRASAVTLNSNHYLYRQSLTR